jgi:hypothetical protein
MEDKWKALASALREELDKVPPAMRQGEVTRATIVCLLGQALRGMGLVPVPGWKPPRSTRDRIDLVGVEEVDGLPVVKVAFAVDPLVELPKVKALEWVDCPDKIFFTFSERQDKVKQSTFFLGAAHRHVSLYLQA